MPLLLEFLYQRLIALKMQKREDNTYSENEKEKDRILKTQKREDSKYREIEKKKEAGH